jgi:hypothetical protein
VYQAYVNWCTTEHERPAEHRPVQTSARRPRLRACPGPFRQRVAPNPPAALMAMVAAVAAICIMIWLSLVESKLIVLSAATAATNRQQVSPWLATDRKRSTRQHQGYAPTHKFRFRPQNNFFAGDECCLIRLLRAGIGNSNSTEISAKRCRHRCQHGTTDLGVGIHRTRRGRTRLGATIPCFFRQSASRCKSVYTSP